MGVKRLLDSMDYEDLQDLKQDLEGGGSGLLQIVHQRITEKERHHGMQCSTCSAEINPYSRHNYTLIFGPIDFRKKASFCAVDCLLYFLGKMKKVQCTTTNPQTKST